MFLLSVLGAVTEAFGEWIVIDLQLCDLLVLIGCDGNELCLLELKGVDVSPLNAGHIVCLYNMQSWLILVH